MSREYTLGVAVRLHTGAEHRFGPYPAGAAVSAGAGPVRVEIGAAAPYPVRTFVEDDERIASVQYLLRAPLDNFEEAIGPDSGRWFMNVAHPTAFWRFGKTAGSRIEDVKTPLYLFTGRDRGVRLAMGVVGPLVETDFELLEPESNRALNVHTRGVTVAIRRGTPDHPLDTTEVTEAVYLTDGGGRPWSAVLRDFARLTREAHGAPDQRVPGAAEPFWCSWTDWASDDVHERMVLDNVKLGVDLGVRNFIIDDGWFGPGLDTAYEQPLNIGDWQPDPAKFPDMRRLVEEIRRAGGRSIIWCAPHAVGPAARCFERRRGLLIADAAGVPIRCDTQFYSMCFMNAGARDVMAGICETLAAEWGFNGAKYDLFNWIPSQRCRSPHHEHDTGSAIEGLRRFLADTAERVARHDPGFIVELKQNYGTALLSPYGACLRAGDAPFDPETNFLRTLHIQAYTPHALNDYQAFTCADTPTDVAVAVAKMLAVGIPAYGCDFTELVPQSRAVIRAYHHLYARHAAAFAGHRTADDPGHAVLRAASPGHDVVFVLRPGAAARVDRPSTVVNAAYAGQVAVDVALPEATGHLTGPAGEPLGSVALVAGTQLVAVPAGGLLGVSAGPR